MIMAAQRKVRTSATVKAVRSVQPRRKKPKAASSRKSQQVSRTHRPPEMSIEEWQVALRRQFAQTQQYDVKNAGNESVFSEFEVTNPATNRTYRVAIRGRELGENYCSCPDYSVNTLGTCKHIEYMLARLGRSPRGRTALARGFHPPYSEVYLRYGAKREVVFRPGTECPEDLRRKAHDYFDANGLLRPDAYGTFPEFAAGIKSNVHDVRCYADALDFIAEVRDRTERSRRIWAQFPDGATSPACRDLLKVNLYPYQCEGAIRLAEAGRCLLADDMGLGKTIQALAATEILARIAAVERVLIVTPTSLKYQWEKEIERCTGRNAMVIDGLIPARTEKYRAESFFKIVNYDVVGRDLSLIDAWQPDLVILDEAQRIKNWKTKTAQSIKRLRSEYAFVLTGTPIENRLEELHSIVEFVDRFRLGPLFRFLAGHQHVDDHGRVIGYHDLGKISSTLEPVLIRRTKDKVLKQLPERLEKRFLVPMTQPQIDHHEENRDITVRIVAKWRRYGFLSEGDQRRLTCALQNMRMACDDAYLLDQSVTAGVKASEIETLLDEVLEDADTKVVVFSQWLRMHELIAERLKARQWDHVFFHGGVPGPERKNLVQRFHDDPACRLFLATDAGGVGLNLQNASVVINVDLPWNPAVLEQRIGRVHRLGQHRPVRVVHFVSQGTIEEGMLNVLAFKKSMFAGVLDGAGSEVFLGGTRLSKFMESVEEVSTATPAGGPTPFDEPPAADAESATAAAEPEAAAEPPAAPAPAAATAAAPAASTAAVPADLAASAATAAPAATAAAPSVAPPAAAPTTEQATTSAPATPSATDPWQGVVTAGMALLDQLGQALQAHAAAQAVPAPQTPGTAAAASAPPPATGHPLIERDAQTGRAYLKFPLPDPAALQKILDVVSVFARK
ncbi:MAG: hypothetical protein A3K19_06385 [Lentisphaerae bacterium RIFOXYB12_FULL_65_16]|nr:MAG: hypothetical protein A3K18_28645 [Lentisphaerae bacterium RIFOXYA12_64_32]OGV93790.1 MAG: hypothetical protein A3K19_06385 [Lentisphaerae bacterium RIFOXYB12_FULL_65_16]